ncbi:DJ-1/PfpI family protein [Acidicapsa acidisoli]|uniref:DJ-1/PfpI family protein n=1 Tax=Acidicapsa acidisoli TaxID=1615681 RepID=UPI0021E03151|nr:DJ-1/PfpI family protein [Acidicapsa acidisoli]
MSRSKKDQKAQAALSETVKLADVKSEDFDTIFYVGGHGPMWDLADNPDSIALIESFYKSGKPVAALCHAPAVFHVTYNGEAIVRGKRVTGLADSEEEAVPLPMLFRSSSRTNSSVLVASMRRHPIGRALRLLMVA